MGRSCETLALYYWVIYTSVTWLAHSWKQREGGLFVNIRAVPIGTDPNFICCLDIRLGGISQKDLIDLGVNLKHTLIEQSGARRCYFYNFMCRSAFTV